MHIYVKNVSVEFPISAANYKSLKRELFKRVSEKIWTKSNLNLTGRDKLTVTSLNGINLSINHDEKVGLIGLNGSGKTTLLRVLSQILTPVSGSIEICGSVSNLIDITSGLELHMSGRENIVLKGMYMGIPPEQMQQQVSDIENFCDLGPFFDLPLSTYSSGMMVRLAFAIATAVKFDILILDEWLSAGDMAFIERAEARLDRFVKSASILVLASHSADLVKNWCKRVIVLDKGEIVYDGPTENAFQFYNDLALKNIKSDQ